jgi:hypothetical protein
VRAFAAAAAALALLLAPATTPAAPHKVHGSFPATASAAIHVRASDGFRLKLEARRIHFSKAELAKFTDPTSATQSTVFLALTRGPGEASYYTPEATFDGQAIEEDLRALGKVSLRFVPRRVTFKRAQKGCVGRPFRIEHGAFVGVLRLHGEHGYTHLLRRRVPGTLTRQPGLSCDLVPKKVAPKGLRVSGSRFRREDGVGFQAQRRGPAGAAHIDAYDSEQRGDLSIQRKVEVEGPAGTLSVDDALTEATVKPPAPFTGEARFHAFAGKQSGTWLGSLAVSFPGAPDVRLAGKAFEGSLLTGDQCSANPGIICVGI